MRKRSMVAWIVVLLLAFGAAACSGSPAPAASTGSSSPQSSQKSEPTQAAPAVSKGAPAKEAAGKGYPSKPIELLNASSAGSPADVMARELGKNAEKFLGQPIVVTTKTGGSGGVQFAAMKAAPADGYTIGATTAAITGVLNTDLKGQFSLDDFQFIIRTQQDPFILITKTGRFKDVKEMIQYAKDNPGKLTIGGNGTASGQHLTALLFAKLAGFTFKWVPYDGGSQSVTAGLGGHVDAVSTAPASIYSFVEAGQATPLVHTGATRLPALKDTPTFKELGYGVTLTQWRGIFAKKGISKEVLDTLHTDFKKAMDEPGWLEYMKNTNQMNGYMGPEEFTASVQKEFKDTTELLKEIGLTKK